MPIWEADILHYYGIYISFGLLFLNTPPKKIIGLAAAVTLAFIFLTLFLAWETGWDFQTLSYTDFWTITGFFRHLLFNGFHPFFPWFAFFLFGLVLGRYNLVEKAVQKICLRWAIPVLILCETISFGAQISTHSFEAAFLFTTPAFPPFPLFVASAMSLSLIIIIVCIRIASSLPSKLITPFVQTGQMVLTHYIAHVIIGLGFLETIGKLTIQPTGTIVIYSFTYFIFSIIVSICWLRFFKKGPIETLMRTISG
jgi:uncharacterized protein